MNKYTWKKRDPVEVDLRSKDGPIFDQGTESSCTSNAGTEIYEFLLKQKGISFHGSRNFLYYAERLIDGDTYKDAGSSLQTIADALVKYGICEEELWPYKNATLYRDPNLECWKSALDHRITGSFRLRTIEDMKNCLIKGNPFMFGAMIYESFQSTIDGYIPMPKPNEKLLGGHALVIMGYIEDKKMFIGRNSWSSLWGDNGYFYLPYEYMMNSDLCSEQIQLIL
jgi:C1A family cysteine protease